jgi:pimeloyl-ACP methyl ester carboxylesterase
MSRELRLPRLGETMEEGRIVRWLKQPGDSYRRGEVLLEVETDKTTVEVPALEDGALIAHLAGPGAMVPVEAPIATIAGDEGPTQAVAPNAAPIMPAPPTTATPARMDNPEAVEGLRASPNARRLARAAGLSLGDMSGTGRQGRIQGWDVAPPLSGLAPRAAEAELAAPPTVTAGTLAIRRWHAEKPVGRPIAMIHGFAGDSAGFDRLARALNALNRSVIALDLPAHGDSPALTLDIHAVADMAARALTPEGAIHLVGHSLGGAVASLAAGKLAVKAVTLIAPVGFSSMIAQGFLDGLSIAETPDAVGSLLALTTRDALRYTPKVLAAVAAGLADPAVRAARVALSRAIADKSRQKLDLRVYLAALDVPTALILGRHDAVIPFPGLVTGLPLTAQHLLDTGHMPHIEATRTVATILARN